MLVSDHCKMCLAAAAQSQLGSGSQKVDLGSVSDTGEVCRDVVSGGGDDCHN